MMQDWNQDDGEESEDEGNDEIGERKQGTTAHTAHARATAAPANLDEEVG